jgi:tetratricopeptide (TPR) repeat protein
MHHVDLDLIHAVLEGDLPAKVLVRQLLAHLTELCPECEQTVAALREAAGDGFVPTPALPGHGAAVEDLAAQAPMLAGGRLAGVVGRAQEKAEQWVEHVRRERGAARREVRELLRAPAEKRRLKIERAQERFRSRAVAELLLEESRRLIREDPEEARNVASLVPVVLLWTPGAVDADWARELKVRAQAWIANTYRVSHRLRKAEQAFEEVRAQMAREMVGEEVHAEVASLVASLRLDQGRFEDARRNLDQAAVLYRSAGETRFLGKTLSKRAILEGRAGDLGEAIDYQRQALSIFEAASETRHLAESAINLALFLAEAGDAGQAASVLGKYRELFQREKLWDEPGAQMIRGRIALAHDRTSEAERLFLAARAELIRKHDPVRAAVASLDLAVLYLAQGKSADLRRMARLMGSVFESAELESEALAAVVLFQRAVEAESVTEAAIRAWRRQLEVARPARRNDQPS